MTWDEYCKKAGVEQCVRDANGSVVALRAGYSDKELRLLLKRHPGWYMSGIKYESC